MAKPLSELAERLPFYDKTFHESNPISAAIAIVHPKIYFLLFADFWATYSSLDQSFTH